MIKTFQNHIHQTMNFRKFSLLIVLSLVYFIPVFNQADISRQWPQFRGYMGKGILDQTDIPATGDITLPADTTRSNQVVWSFKRGGAYIASPLVYGDYLYNMQINGQLTCIEALTGAVKYKKDLGKAFSASGVASGEKLYFPAETGEIYVIQAGPEYKLLAENHMDDVCMATPAITDGMIIFRTQHSMIAIGKK